MERIRRKIIYTCVLFLIMSGYLILSAECSTSQIRIKFYEANSYYSEGKYDKAIDGYEWILAQGVESGNIYYNLGNSYFKKGELGRAVLNYEKAKRFIPRDSDLKSNYEYAQSLVKTTVPVEKKVWLVRLIDRIFGLFTVDGLTVLLSIIYILFLTVIVAGACIRRVRRYRIVLTAVLLLIFVPAFLTLKKKVSVVGREAVVTVERTDAKFEPFDKATAHFTLYEGMKVNVLSESGLWEKIKRPDGKIGWVKKDKIVVF